MTQNLTTTLTGIVALLSSIATTVLSILLTAYLTPRRQKATSLAVVAIILQCIALCTTVLLIFSHLREGSRFGLAGSRRERNCYFLLSCLVVEFVAGATTGVMLGWTYDELVYLQDLVEGQDPTNFMLVIIVVYGLAELFQIVFLICLVWVRQPVTDHLPAPIHDIPEMSAAIRSVGQPATVMTVHLSKSRQASLSSPLSAAPSGHSSRRSSLSIITRPSSSRSKLLRQNSYTRYSRSSSFENSTTARPSQDSGFDTWDTSTVGSHLRETVLHSLPPTKRANGALEPIPGSRSPSPAKALEGPFFATATEPSPPSSPLPQPSYSSRPLSPQRSAPPSPLLQSSFSRPPSRQRSPSCEDHIHPLFRSYSPSPPPTASSGTIVLAAPVAGQLVNERILRRMRSGSLPSSPMSPSPLVRSESYFDFATAPTSPTGGAGTPAVPDFILVASASEKAMGRPGAWKRAASMKEVVTPPIPDFVLNAGERREQGARRAVSVREGVGLV